MKAISGSCCQKTNNTVSENDTTLFVIFSKVVIMWPCRLSFLFFALTALSIIKQNAGDLHPNLRNECNASDVSEANVLEYLHKLHPTYTSDARPTKSSQGKVVGELSLALFGIKDFAEHEGTLFLDGYLQMVWHDEFLRWNDEFPYQCVEYLLIGDRPIWRPNIVLPTNSIDDFRLQIASTKILVYSNGRAEFYPEGQFSTSCDLDLTMFPFDIQECTLYVDSWNYDNRKMAVKLANPAFFKVDNFWTENRQWAVVDNSSKIMAIKYDGFVGYYDRAVFKLLLRRKPLFYYVNVIIPGIVIAVVELVTFVLPIAEVVKLSISVTCLLAYSVFQGMIIGDMPRSGKSVPLLSLYIDLQMAYIGIIAILGDGLVFLLYGRASSQQVSPPRWLYFVMKCLGRMLLHPIRRSPLPKEIGKDYPDLAEILKSKVSMKKDSNAELKLELDSPVVAADHWIYLAEVVARLNMINYITAITVTPIIMFFVLPPNTDRASLPK